MILSNSIAFLVQTTRCTMMRFCWSIPLSIDYDCSSSIDRLFRLIHAHIAYEIDTAKIIAAFCRITRWCGFCWSIPLSIDYVWNSSIDRLSRLLHAHIGYEIDTAKIIAAICRISYCLHDLIRLNSIVCHVQTTRCTMMWFSMID